LEHICFLLGVIFFGATRTADELEHSSSTLAIASFLTRQRQTVREIFVLWLDSFTKGRNNCTTSLYISLVLMLGVQVPMDGLPELLVQQLVLLFRLRLLLPVLVLLLLWLILT
jgi:hypothetical protein